MSDATEVRALTRNRDNDGLRSWGNKRIVVGYVHEVNGPGAAEAPDFVATEHELITLVKHWGRVALHNEFFWFIYQVGGSSDTCETYFAYRRIARIADLIGQDEVDRIIDEVWEDFGKQQNVREWNLFRNGTKEQVKAFHIEREEDLSGLGTTLSLEQFIGQLEGTEDPIDLAAFVAATRAQARRKPTWQLELSLDHWFRELDAWKRWMGFESSDRYSEVDAASEAKPNATSEDLDATAF